MGKFVKIYILIVAAVFLVGSHPIPIFADDLATQQQLQDQLAQIQAQIDTFTQQLKGIQAQKNTLANKIKALQKQQALLQLQIQATTLQVNRLGDQITQTIAAIAQNNTKA